MRVYHWIIGGLVLVLIGLTGYFGIMIYEDFTKDDQQVAEETEDAVTDQEDQQVTELSDEKFENGDPSELNPFGDSLAQNELRSSHYKEYIHLMSHQKVEADEKWGFYLITEERINWLLNGLDEVELGDAEQTYETILERWANGDFSQVDHDHNIIWEMQGGTIGRAKGVLSQQEEEEYINKKKQ